MPRVNGPALRPYELSDNLRANSGTVWLTGTQALVRLMLMQRQRDAAAGLRTGGFVSGYRGSPLGMVDQQMWKAMPLLEAAGVQFLPAINEDLAATACLGTQRVALDPARRVDGVFALWYGKGPGVDRAGDALKHGHVFGSSPLGGVLVVCGDDHGCVSSSMPHQSDLALAHFGMPVLHPANVAEYLEFGLYGWALSRYSGAWVGFKAISEVVESGMTVDLDAVPIDFALPVQPEAFTPPRTCTCAAWTCRPLTGVVAHAADGEVRQAQAVDDLQARDAELQFLKLRDAGVLQRGAGDHVQRLRHVLPAFLALAGGDGDGLGGCRIFSSGSGGGRRRRRRSALGPGREHGSEGRHGADQACGPRHGGCRVLGLEGVCHGNCPLVGRIGRAGAPGGPASVDKAGSPCHIKNVLRTFLSIGMTLTLLSKTIFDADRPLILQPTCGSSALPL